MRCAICRAVLESPAATARCSECAVLTHVDCRDRAGACPTAGCPGVARSTDELSNAAARAAGPAQELAGDTITLGAPITLSSDAVTPGSASAAATRCAICRTPIADLRAAHQCPSCAVISHADCREFTGACPTFACDAASGRPT